MQWNVLVTKHRLLGQAFKVQKTDSTRDCIDICDQQTQCRSINFNWVDFLCELNKVDVHVAPQKLYTTKGYVYLDNPWPKIQLVSCNYARKYNFWKLFKHDNFVVKLDD